MPGLFLARRRHRPDAWDTRRYDARMRSLLSTLVVPVLLLSACAPPPAARSDDAADRPAERVAREQRVDVAPGIRAFPARREVEIDAVTCLDAGWLEQVACGPRSREHESLVVVEARPSDIHAALLLVGLEAGSPGWWRYENDDYRFEPPTGDEIAVSVRYPGPGGAAITDPIRNWIRDHHGRHAFPAAPWIFAGSRFETDETGEHYVADDSGSVVGLVTFGDEVVGFSTVIADAAAVHAPEWEVDSDAVPEPGTEVVLILTGR